MQARKIIEIAIYPKIFSVLSFYSKGQYAVSISVKQELLDGTVLPSYPTILRRTEINIHESKKPQVKIENQEAAFITEQFYVTYNEETVVMNSIGVFKMEIDPATHCQAYIDFQLVAAKQRKKKGEAPDQKTPAPKVLVPVDSRRLYVKKIGELDQCKRVVFSDCEYFSFLDVRLDSAYLGTKFRIHNEQLLQFSNMDNKLKISHQGEALLRRMAISDFQRGELLKRVTGLSAADFKSKLGSETLSSYVGIKRRLEFLVKLNSEESSVWSSDAETRAILEHDLQYDTLLTSRQGLQKIYETSCQEELYMEIYREISEIDHYTRYVWNKYLSTVLKIPIRIFSLVSHKCLTKENSLREKNMVIHGPIDDAIRQAKHGEFLKRRKEVLDNMSLYEEDDAYHPFMMVESFKQPQVTEVPSFEITSLVVFVHGYQGTDYDLEKAKNFLFIYGPNVQGLLIKSIQDEIDEDLEHLGVKVATEIRTHISGSFNNYKKISLVGYSLGGIVIRECLKNLEDFKEKMNLLVTFASPHLGVSRPDNRLVGTGIWYLINVNKVKNLKQLNCETNENSEVTLQKLSKCESLGWFKKVVLVSSKEDSFVPHYSSRVDPNIEDSWLREMAENILKRAKKVERMEVWFDVEHNIGTFDKILGRRAHIEFLENRIFLDMFFRLYSSQF